MHAALILIPLSLTVLYAANHLRQRVRIYIHVTVPPINRAVRLSSTSRLVKVAYSKYDRCRCHLEPILRVARVICWIRMYLQGSTLTSSEACCVDCSALLWDTADVKVCPVVSGEYPARGTPANGVREIADWPLTFGMFGVY